MGTVPDMQHTLIHSLLLIPSPTNPRKCKKGPEDSTPNQYDNEIHGRLTELLTG